MTHGRDNRVRMRAVLNTEEILVSVHGVVSHERRK